jgi:anti-sigma factor RsiW
MQAKTGGEMECAAIKNRLQRKIDGDLGDPENAEVDAHLAQCPSCMREFRMLGLPGWIGRILPPITPPPYFYQALRARIEGELQGGAGWQVFLVLTRRMVPAMAGITLALLSLFAYLQIRSPEVNLYSAYSRAWISEDPSHRMLIAEQQEITDASVLRAIAERTGSHSNDIQPK